MTARVLALCNQKGGVGKTSVTLGLAAVLANQGRRVLVIDADPQSNATSTLGLDDPPFSLNDVLTVHPVTQEIQTGVLREAVVSAGEAWSGVEVVASELALAGREQDQVLGREFRLRTALDGTLGAWDVVLIDCPPSLGQLTVNALAAADSALLVTEPRVGSVEGLAYMTSTMSTIRQHFNDRLSLAGVVVNKHRSDRVDRMEWVEQLRADYPDHLIEPFLGEREIVATATSAGAPITNFGARSREIVDALTAIAERVLPLT